MTRSSRSVPPREAAVLRSCVAVLRARGFQVERQNTGVMRVDGRFVRFGSVGRPDLYAVGHGLTVFVEVKRPGRRPTPRQLAWLRGVVAAGALACWTDSAATLDRVLTRLLAGWRVEINERGGQVLISPDED